MNRSKLTKAGAVQHIGAVLVAVLADVVASSRSGRLGST